MAELAEFQRRQLEFAAHIRDPQSAPAPEGIEDRRMAIYRSLFLNNLASLLESTFPVLRKLHDRPRWLRLVRNFMKHHEAHTPLFLEVPREFLDYLTREREPEPDDPPFLRELAHYEWAELALSVAPDPDPPSGLSASPDWLDEAPVVSPLAWLLRYDYPVHRVSPEYRPQAPGDAPTFLVIYRRPSDELGFLELNAVTARLFELLDADKSARTGRDVLTQIASELGHPSLDVVIAGGIETLTRMHALDIVLGTRRP